MSATRPAVSGIVVCFADANGYPGSNHLFNSVSYLHERFNGVSNLPFHAAITQTGSSSSSGNSSAFSSPAPSQCAGALPVPNLPNGLASNPTTLPSTGTTQ